MRAARNHWVCPREKKCLLMTPQGPSRQVATPTVGRWALSLGLVVLGGLSWFIFGFGLVGGPSVVAALAAVVPALSCLVAGWLLRSWWVVVPTLVYMGVSAVMWALADIGNPAETAFWISFAFYVLLPGLVMALIGTAIGMFTAGGQGQRLQYGH
jgi:hypothetical protein